jgi:Protein of unknown function (DUF1353)
MITYSSPENFKQPVVQYVGKREFVLVLDYLFEWENNGLKRRFWIPAGYNYDKASTPRLLWGWFPPDGEHEAAALIHDRLYQFKGKLPAGEYQVFINNVWTDDASPWTRAQADKMFEYMATLGGMPKHRAFVEKMAVKLYPPNWLKGF